MPHQETIDNLDSVIVLLFNICKEHIQVKLRSGALSSYRGRFYLLERNSFQVLLDDPNIRLKSNKEIRLISYLPEVGTLDFTTAKEVRLISYFPEVGTLDFTTTVVGFGNVRTTRGNIRKIIHVFNLPKVITINDRREEPRYKIPLKENIWAYFDMSKSAPSDEKAEGGKSAKRSIIPLQIVDVGPGGIQTLPPRPKSRLGQLMDAEPPLSAVIEFPDLEVNTQFSLLKDKQPRPGQIKHLHFRFHGPSEQATGKIMGHINQRKKEEEEKDLKRITVILQRRNRIVDPRTLKNEMKEGELDRLKWRRKGNTFFIQTDKLIKGEAAFHIYVPKKGEEGVWVRRGAPKTK